MSSNVLEGRSLALRLEYSVADAVRQRGITSVLGEALGAWWAQRPSHYSDVPDHLRADLGLPPADRRDCLGIGLDTFRLHPPNWRPY
ncbi:hypothetical protein [Devosia faecipullorum]|uniref:hypothetical protein n=1 Tax=Devosia faecipullorum TaxID=2755039 RepID=UPI00187BA0A0|nr:hypothetical protein [Devosia faecipullorum]MBE7733934.1 hypothetical protein [Devosia faecipullorum]